MFVIVLLFFASVAIYVVEAKPEYGFVPNEFIIGFKDLNGMVLSDVENIGGIVIEQIPALDAVCVRVPPGREHVFVSSVWRIPGVRYVERNGIFRATYVPDDPYWKDLWGMQVIQADYAWDIYKGSTSIVVAIVDTGIEYTHEDLQMHYVSWGYDWVNNDNDPMDDHGHGTHCAGIVAAVMDNGIGVVGVGQVSIMAEKVLDSDGSGTAEWVANGITHAVDAGADVISLSLGAYYDYTIIKDACSYAWNNGVLIVAAAGNDNTDEPHYPSAYETVISVAATNRDDKKASYSNYGSTIELSAPGGDRGNYRKTYILSTYTGNSYAYMYGTSMACPHVSGLAALVWSYETTLTNEELRLHLRNTADDLGDAGWDPYYGYGRINAYRALSELGDAPPTCSIVDPEDGQVIQGTCRILVSASDDNQVSQVELAIDSGTWIDITSNFDGTYYYYDWDTTTVADGSHTIDARATDNAGQTTYATQVTVTVDNIPGEKMHVGDISMWYQKRGPWYWVYTEVPILDENGQPVADATVYLDTTLPDGSVQSFSGTTGSDGTVTFKLRSKLSGTYTSTVTDVVKEGWTYDSASNIETSESLNVP
jgi:serine protease